jgi:hypothetical protein
MLWVDPVPRENSKTLFPITVGQAISRFGKRLQTVAELRRNITKLEEQLEC